MPMNPSPPPPGSRPKPNPPPPPPNRYLSMGYRPSKPPANPAPPDPVYDNSEIHPSREPSVALSLIQARQEAERLRAKVEWLRVKLNESECLNKKLMNVDRFVAALGAMSREQRIAVLDEIDLEFCACCGARGDCICP